jgi:hypothetical protein
VPYLRKMLESCEKRAGRKGRRATSVSLSVVMSREGSFYDAALVRMILSQVFVCGRFEANHPLVVNLALIRVAGKMLAIAFICVRLIYVVHSLWHPGSSDETGHEAGVLERMPAPAQ